MICSDQCERGRVVILLAVLLSLIDTLSRSHVFGSKVFSGKTNSGQKV